MLSRRIFPGDDDYSEEQLIPSAKKAWMQKSTVFSLMVTLPCSHCLYADRLMP